VSVEWDIKTMLTHFLYYVVCVIAAAEGGDRVICSICLYVNRATQKVLKQFSWNLVLL